MEHTSYDSEYPEGFLKKLHNKFSLEEILIIKSHLFIEFMLNKFITCHNMSKTKLESMNFTFSQKVNICVLLGLFEASNSELLEFIKQLNTLRNQVAHKHTFEDELLDKLVNFPNGFDSQKKYKTKRNYRIYILEIKTAFLCGKIQAAIDLHNTTIKNM